MRDVPAEILGLIFLEATISAQALSPYTQPFPFLVSQVCKLWRNVALGTPALWTLVVVPCFYQPSTQRPKEVTDRWIKLSGALPISVILDARFTRQSPNFQLQIASSEFMTAMLQFILEAAGDKLNRLEMSIPLGFRYDGLPKIADSANLEELTVIDATKWLGLLRSASFDGEAIPNPSTRRLRWANSRVPKYSNLTHFSAKSLCMSYTEMCSLFQGSPHLSHLSLDEIRPIHPTPRVVPPRIKLPSLTHVAIRANNLPLYIDPGKQIFTLVDLPNLHYLELNNTICLTLLFGLDAIPKIAESVRVLMIADYTDEALKDSYDRDQNLIAIEGFRNLRHLCHASAPFRILAPASATNSSTSSEGNLLGVWPHLCHITFDHQSSRVAPKPLLDICNLVKDRPMMSRLDVSSAGISRLRDNIARNGNHFNIPIREWDMIGELDVVDWISARMRLQAIQGQVVGMLYNRSNIGLDYRLPEIGSPFHLVSVPDVGEPQFT